MLLGESLLQTADSDPDRFALYHRDQTVCFARLADSASRLASGLAGFGVQAGDRVALLFDNCPEFVIGYYAIQLAGGVAVPTNTFLAIPEIESIYRHAQMSHLLADCRRVAALAPVLKKLPGFKGVVAAACGEEASAVALPSGLPLQDFDELTGAGSSDFAQAGRARPSDLAVLQYTSGTTGRPKGVMLSHENLLLNAEAVSRALNLTPEDRFLLALPAFHSFSQTVCLVTPVMKGAGMCVVPRLERSELGYSLLHHRPTLFPGVPALFHMLSMAPAPPPEKNPVRLYISGGAPLPPAVQQRFEENYQKPIYEGYGLTEASPVVSWNLPGRHRPGSVGQPVEGVEVGVRDAEGRELPAGEVGELCIRAASVMSGYYRAEEETAEALRKGWLYTGDMARVDQEGYITIVDRKKDLILHKGLNVYPSEIERVLMQRPEIAEAAVVGVPDGAHGESPEAVVVFHPEQSVEESELKAHCRENLAAYKVPRRIHVREQLPKTPTGKVLKAELRAGLPARSRTASE